MADGAQLHRGGTQSPHATGTPSSAPPPPTEASDFAQRPVAANTTAQDASIPNPATRATPSTVPPTTIATTSYPPTSEPATLNEKLNASDRYWKFKTALRTALILTNLIGLGCISWILSSAPRYSNNTLGDDYGYDTFWTLWPTLVTFSVSILWSTICILIFLLRKKPVHPGARVALDLLLWLGFLATALLALAALSELLSWSPTDNLNGFTTSRGDYEQAQNGTWVWEQDSSYVSSARSCSGSAGSASSYYEYNDVAFTDCAAQDAYVNKLWREKPHRVNVELTGVVCQFFGLVLHFTLFVWACVDTHRLRRSRVIRDAEKIATGIVQTMISNGAVMPPPGQAYMRPAMGQGVYYQLPAQQQQQAYPMAQMYPQGVPVQQGQMMAPGQYPVGYPAGQGLAPGPSSEKGKGPRYA